MNDIDMNEAFAVEGGGDFWCPIPFDPTDPFPWKGPWATVLQCPPLV